MERRTERYKHFVVSRILDWEGKLYLFQTHLLLFPRSF
jgi:hypothetical protein